jgi:hypothetical protein
MRLEPNEVRERTPPLGLASLGWGRRVIALGAEPRQRALTRRERGVEPPAEQREPRAREEHAPGRPADARERSRGPRGLGGRIAVERKPDPRGGAVRVVEQAPRDVPSADGHPELRESARHQHRIDRACHLRRAGGRRAGTRAVMRGGAWAAGRRRGGGPVHGGAEVLYVMAEPLDLGPPRPREEPRLGVGHQHRGPRQVAVAGGGLVRSPSQECRTVLPYRLEQRVSHLAPLVAYLHQRLLDEAADRLEHACGVERRTSGRCALPCCGGAHLRCGVEREAAAEHTQAREQRALGGGEQVVTPVEERPERAVAR